MKRKIPCFCDNTFEVEVPAEINLDTDPGYLDEILDGSFFNFTCPICGKKHKPEFPLSIQWPSKNLCFEIIPETERGEFYRTKKPPVQKEFYTMETIIGYPEMADRLAVIRDGLEPVPVEAIKYYLYLKAEEQYPDEDIEIWYFASSAEALEFHVHGIRENQIAIMKVPLSLYNKNLEEYKQRPKSEIFSALRVQTYLSVKNTMRQ